MLQSPPRFPLSPPRPKPPSAPCAGARFWIHAESPLWKPKSFSSAAPFPPEHQKERAKFAKTTSNEFEAQYRRPDPEQVALVVGKITAIRAETAGMRAE